MKKPNNKLGGQGCVFIITVPTDDYPSPQSYSFFKQNLYFYRILDQPFHEQIYPVPVCCCPPFTLCLQKEESSPALSLTCPGIQIT